MRNQETKHSAIHVDVLWSRGGLAWRSLGVELCARVMRHNLLDRAALLSYYFLVALFPLLILLSSLIGFFLASQAQTYWRLLGYFARFMPNSAFLLFSNVLQQIKSDASGGKLSFGLILTLWASSSGVSSLIEALNVAFDVASSRSWWRRRLVAVGLTLSISGLLAVSLLFIFLTSSAGTYITANLPVARALSGISTGLRWLVDFGLLFLTLTLIYGFGPYLRRKRWKGILPGATLALCCWILASWGLRLYLSTFSSLSHSYGSLAGVIALLFWLYASAMAILIGGELNATIWNAVVTADGQSILPQHLKD